MMTAFSLHIRESQGNVQVSIEDKERELLEAITALGKGWYDRQDIAARLSKNRLNPVEIAALDLLVTSGKLEKELRPGEQPHVNRWVYRVSE